MKGIFLTEETKQEIEAKIAELEEKKSFKSDNNNIWYFQGRIDLLKEILSSATILPVEEDLDDLPVSVLMGKQNIKHYYPNGLIIQPK